MFACDFDLNITFISCGWEGSVIDARVLSSAIQRGFKVPNGKFYLVDGGYARSIRDGATDVESDDEEREMTKQAALDEEEDLQMLDQSEMEQAQVNQRNVEIDIEQGNQRSAEMEQVQVNHRKAVAPSTNKSNKPKRSPKKSSGDGLVGVMERFVNIKEKEANREATQDFSITKCIATLRTLEEFSPAEKARAFAVFKSVENREIFLSAVDEKDGSALIWLRSEMDNLI